MATNRKVQVIKHFELKTADLDRTDDIESNSEKSTLGSEATNLVLPMITGDIQKAFEMERSLGVAKMLPSLVGIGTGVYDKKKKKKEPEERAEREEKPEKPEK